MKRVLVVLLSLSCFLFVSCFSYKFTIDDIKYTTSEDCVTASGLRVFQVLDENYALCKVLKPIATSDGSGLVMTNMVVVLHDSVKNSFYENKEILIPMGKRAVTIGVMRYKRTFKHARVFPVVEIK